ncbi:MAG: DNA translocase FtsK 4TM domain-containing protein [Bacteroidaceae bacterium]|nr:DNA translocase FtsK 4TM domain-containing protein [Bacteroidaceae bacterium]
MSKRTTPKTPQKGANKRRGVPVEETQDSSLHMGEAIKGSKDEPLKRSEAIRMACGIVLLALAVFTIISLVSHLFTGGEDQKVLQSGYIGTAKNWAGYLGAWWSDYWITKNFGLGSFFISIFLLAASLKLTGATRVRLWKWFVNCSFLLCWVSVAAAFFLTGTFEDNPDISYISPGGYHGINVVNFLENVSGPVGTYIILLLTLLAYLCYLSTETIRILKRLMHPKQLARDLGSHLPSINMPSLKREKNDEEGTEEEAEDTEDAEADATETDTAEDTKDADGQEEAIVIPMPTDVPKKQKGTTIVAVTTEGDDDIPVAAVASLPQETDTSWITAATGEEAAQPVKTGETGVELTIEPPVEEEIVDEESKVALEPYDPKLDLENYRYPTLELLKHYDIDAHANIDMEEQTKNKDQIVTVLRSFGVEISSIRATVGPTITLYEITPAPGVRISKIRNLEDDIALSLAALGIRIIAPIPGKGTIGIEVPNAKPQIVSMESILNSKKFQETTMELPMALGKTITNEVYMADLAKMPHLLVAGATGQGKSVGLNAIITSLLYKKHPAELKLVMVDPKKVEFSIYSPIINHFLAQIEDEDDEPIITDVQKVINTLKSLCVEMDTRYDLLKKARARNLKEYNEKFKNRQLNPEHGHKFMPYIVVIIDEFGDLIMTAGKEIELPIARIAQLARAVGIHMIIATQRPTTNIITGTIKANFPARMAFKVSAMIDSRTILDRPGANQLVGKGDMLFLAGNDPVRVQCAFVDTPEVERICSFIACQQSYTHPFALPRPPMEDAGGGANDVDMDNLDPMFADAAKLIVTSQQGSTSMIQRKFSIGYNRAGRLMDQLEKAGVVGPAQGSKPREVLIQDEMSLEMLLNDLG